MSLDIVLNELSLQPAPVAATERMAKQLMATFVHTLLTATRLGLNRTLLTHQDINYIDISAGYPIARWRNDLEVDIEARRYFRTLATKAPYIDSVDDPEKRERLQLRQVNYDGRTAQGLGCALILDTLSVSLASRQDWGAHRLRVTVERLEDDGNLVEDFDEVAHACSPVHVEQNRSWLEERQKSEVFQGKELWQQRGSLFRSLEFCAGVEDSIVGLGSSDELFLQIRKKLFQLEMFCQEWTEGPFDETRIPFKVTPESKPTLDTKKYRAMRTILCPDGTRRVFSWHGRLTPGNWRIFLFPLESTRRLIVGYIGEKLPTVEYPT